jgi:hypothetical protein
MSRNPETRLARSARLLGAGHNPLRRRTDRIEAVIILITIVLLVVAVPLAALAAGRHADHVELRHAQALLAKEHQVTAVLLQQAPATGVPDPYSSVQMSRVQARWQPPGQPPRTGQVAAPAGTPVGRTVPVWIDASGAVTAPPPDHRSIVGDVFVASVATGLITGVLVLSACGLARRILDRRRLRAWDAEWQAAGPRWSGHAS